METITHTTSIAKPPSEVFEAFSSLGGIRSWWTNAISGNPDKNGELTQQFGMDRHIVFSVSGMKKNSFITLTALSSNFADGKEAIGASLTLKASLNSSHNSTFSIVYENWKNKTPFFKTQDTYWKERMESLKKICEQGKGDPEIVTLPRK